MYCPGNPVRLIDPTGMEDEESNSMRLDKMYPNMLNEVVVQGEGTRIKQFDQVYGETVTGGMGQGSQSTSKFHGPSIDASDIPQNLGGEGSKGMQFIYNLVKRVGQLVDNWFGNNSNQGDVSGNTINHINPHITGQNNKYMFTYPRERYRPVISKNGDTIGIREMKFNLDAKNEPYYMRDTCIYGVPIDEIRKKCK